MIRPDATPGGQHLFITILEGEGAVNNIRQRDAREPVVQVTDENHKPVAGVTLLFLIHGSNGATATFGGDALTLSTTTDANGIARTGSLHIGTHPGTISVTVTASAAGGVVASAVIHQSNIITPINADQDAAESGAASAGSQASTKAAAHGIAHLSKTALIATGAAVAAAVVVGVVIATKGSDSTSLTLGASTVGQP
jgi:hypothetical protein